MRRIALPALLLALLGLLAWVALRPEESGNSPATSAGSSGYVVRVVTEYDATPVPGVRVADVSRGTSLLTDAAGAVRFDALEPAPAGGTTSKLRVRACAPRGAERSVAPGETVLRVPRPVAVDVHFVDAETGAELPPLSHSASGWWMPEDTPADAALQLLGPGAEYEFSLLLAELGAGRAAPARSALRRRGRLSRFATRARLELAIPRAARIVVHVADEAGAPVADAEVEVRDTAGDFSEVVRTDEHGDARPQHVPHYRGEHLSISAHLGSQGTETRSLLLGAAEDEHVARLVLDRTWQVTYRFGGGTGSQRRVRDGGRRDAPSGASSLLVRVQLHEGRSAADMPVRLRGPWTGARRADATGVARFDGLPAGSYAVSCTDVALLGLREELVLGDGTSATLTLVEARGVPLELRVQDAAGHGLAGAELTLEDADGNAWAVLRADGTQELALRSDADGTLRLAEGPPRARVSAVYGRSSGTASADESGRATVVVE